VELVLQALIDSEATKVIGAGPHERTTTRTNQRIGTRDRLLSTKTGDVELRIPKPRHGSFPRSAGTPPPYRPGAFRGGDRGVRARGLAALGLESGISKSEASRICSELDDTLEAFRTRPTRHGVTGKPGTKRISRVRVRPENGAYVWRKPHDSEGARASEASGER
jgi:putative transposase